MNGNITIFITWPSEEVGLVDYYEVRLLDDQGGELSAKNVNVSSAIFENLAELTTYQVELVAYVGDDKSDPQIMDVTTPAGEATTTSLTVSWEAPESGDSVRLLNNRREVIQDIGLANPPVTVTGLTRYAHNYLELTRANGDVELFWLYTPPKTLPDVTSNLILVADGYNPHPQPIPNPTAIPRTGRSIVQGVTALLEPPAWFDQRDGSGGSHLTPEGVVSRSDRQGRISGNTTDQNGQPVSRRVRCFERRTGRLVRETWSNAAGYYQFDDLDPGKRFTVVAHDYGGEYNAVIADNAQPEVPA